MNFFFLIYEIVFREGGGSRPFAKRLNLDRLLLYNHFSKYKGSCQEGRKGGCRRAHLNGRQGKAISNELLDGNFLDK